MTDIQLSGDTFIDNDVLNFSEHQIEALRDIAAKPQFSGLVEPDFSKRRKRGAFVAQWFCGKQRYFAVIGLYRTMPYSQRGELRTLRDKLNGVAHFKLLQAMHQFTFDGANDEESLALKLDEHIRQLQEALRTDCSPIERGRLAYRLARTLIIYGNLTTALKGLEDEEKADDPQAS